MCLEGKHFLRNNNQTVKTLKRAERLNCKWFHIFIKILHEIENGYSDIIELFLKSSATYIILNIRLHKTSV